MEGGEIDLQPPLQRKTGALMAARLLRVSRHFQSSQVLNEMTWTCLEFVEVHGFKGADIWVVTSKRILAVVHRPGTPFSSRNS
jgi:hypothetical protein